MSLRSTLRAILTLGRGVVRGLPDLTPADDPIALFETWLRDARDSGLLLPEAMTVATSTPGGVPSARMMLLKGVGPDGFVFYTNYESHKAHQLDANPRAALVFFWNVLERQVRVEGRVERVPPETSDAYFRTRPRGSQLGAWASHQSAPLESRDALEERFRRHEAEFAGREIPRPPFWGGYRLDPERIEFWQGRLNRLHDRFAYEREPSGGWRVTRLFP